MEAVSKIKSLEHIKLVIVFVALNIIDAALTNIILNAGGTELNPMMHYLWKRGIGLAWSVEIGSSLIVAFAFLILATYMPRLIKVVLIVWIIYMTVVCLWGGICLFN